MAFDVITVGSGTVDMFVETGEKLFHKTNISKDSNMCLIPFGSKIVIDEIIYDIGGGGTNTAVAFRKLGLRTAWLGKIGIDANADRIIKVLKKEKVNTKLICRCKKNSGYSIILDAKGHDRTILAYKGSNNDLTIREIPIKKLKTKWFYFSSMMGESFKTMEALAEFSEANDINIAFNPSSYLVKRGADYLKQILNHVDVLIYNKEEATILVGKGTIDSLLKISFTLVPGIVVITDGKKGAYCYDGKLVYFVKGNTVKVIESTGAGDSFAAAFVSALVMGKNIKTALKWGVANAQSVVTHYGAKNLLLTRPEIINKVRKERLEVKARF